MRLVQQYMTYIVVEVPPGASHRLRREFVSASGYNYKSCQLRGTAALVRWHDTPRQMRMEHEFCHVGLGYLYRENAERRAGRSSRETT